MSAGFFISFQPSSVLLALTLAAPGLHAQAPSRPQLHALRNVRLSEPDDGERATLVLRSGAIDAIQDASIEPSIDMRVIDGEGQLALPAFLDAYTHAGCATPEPSIDRDFAPKPSADVWVDMRAANRKGIAPAFRAADVFQLDPDLAKRYRSLGFGALLSAPHGELLAGSSALASTREAAVRDLLLEPVGFDHASFEARGPGYPSTSMGAIAQLRQLFLDARHVDELERRRAEGKPGSRPPYDKDLDAVRPMLLRQRKLVCEAQTANEIERWLAFAKEFALDIAISGGRDAWKLADVLAGRKIPVILTLDWGEEVENPHEKDVPSAKKSVEHPDGESKHAPERQVQPEGMPVDTSSAAPPASVKDETPSKRADTASKRLPADSESDRWMYTEPLRVREEKRQRWEESRDAAIHLSDAHVVFAFGSGKSTPRELLERVRKLVEIGLPLHIAMAGLTTTPAELCGRAQSLGRIAEGADASIAVWTKHPLLDKDAKVAHLFVEGFSYAFDLAANELGGRPDQGVDVTGTWLIEFDTPNAKPARAELEMSRDGEVNGKIVYVNPQDAGEIEGRFEGHVEGKNIRLSGKVGFGTYEAVVDIQGQLTAGEIEGKTTWKWSGGEDRRTFTATRQPKSFDADQMRTDSCEDGAQR